MDVNKMREHVAHAYGGPYWRAKVMYEMSDRQVIAIYKDMLERGKINKKKPRPYKKKHNTNYKEPVCEQLSIWDIENYKEQLDDDK